MLLWLSVITSCFIYAASVLSQALFIIQQVNYKPQYKEPEQKSHELRDFVDHALTMNPDMRWSADRLLQHPFITTRANDTHLRGLGRLVIAARESIAAKNAGAYHPW